MQGNHWGGDLAPAKGFHPKMEDQSLLTPGLTSVTHSFKIQEGKMHTYSPLSYPPSSSALQSSLYESYLCSSFFFLYLTHPASLSKSSLSHTVVNVNSPSRLHHYLDGLPALPSIEKVKLDVAGFTKRDLDKVCALVMKLQPPQG